MAAELAVTGGSAIGLGLIAFVSYRRLMTRMAKTGNLGLF
jgi:hypothetical protein